jgi:3-oxoacyl-[acyl-carrier-protein] synthase II
MNRRVVVTGLGVATPVGTGADAYWDALWAGRSGIGPISLFDASGLWSQSAAEVRDLSSVELPGRKEQWTVSRSITLGFAAAKLALEHARITVTEENRSQIGVVYGSTLACLNLLARFDQQALREGPRTCDPVMFPDTGVSAPACRVSILLGINAFNATLSNGPTSGLDAIAYGVHFIRMGRAHTVLAGGVEELCFETFLGYYRRGFLSGARDGGEEACRPFDRRRNGIVMGEGSAVLALEDLEHARERGATILAEVRGYGTAFDPLPCGGYDREARGATAAMANALGQAELAPAEVDWIAASASGSRVGDSMEAKATSRLFGTDRHPPVTALKSMLGDSYSAAGALQSAAAVLALHRGGIPPTMNCSEPDDECLRGSLVTSARDAKLKTVLVNSFGCNGNNASIVLAAA